MAHKGVPIVVLICCVGTDLGLYLVHSNQGSAPDPFMVGIGLLFQFVGLIFLATASGARTEIERLGLKRSRLVVHGVFALIGGFLTYAHGIFYGAALYVPLLK